MTASIGFRSPTPAQWLEAIQAVLGDDAAMAATLARPFDDRDALATTSPAEIPGIVARRLQAWQAAFRPSTAILDQALGRMLSEPKPQVWFDADPARLLDPSVGLVVDRRSRLLYRGPWVFINGEALRPPARSRRWLQRLADRRHLSAVDLAAALPDASLEATLGDWLAAGWIGHASD